MAEDTTSGMVTPPIIPALPQIESAKDPLAQLRNPPPVISPLIPTGIPQNLPTNIQVQGDYRTGPTPGSHPANLQNGTADFVNAVKNQMTDDTWAKDRFKYGKSYSYGAGYKNQNFERYYKHPKFNQLGFNPYRDNDTYYNQRSSWADDHIRMQGQWGGLAWSGLKSVWGSEITANKEMEKGMAIGTSTKGGFGGWVTNFGLNTAYTTGIMAEMALENAALFALEVGTFGGAAPAVEPVRAARNTMLFGKLARAVGGTYDFLKGLKNAEKAKEFFTAANLGAKGVDALNWINPLERTTKLATNLAKGSGGVASLTNKAKIARGFGDFYKDIRELNLAHSEARLEGEGAAQQYQDKLIDEYYAEHGYMAEGKDAQDIHDRAQSVKATVTMANDFTIYATNKIVFQNLLDGLVPGKGIAEGFLKGSGRVLERTAPKAFKAGETAGVKAAEIGAGKKVANFLLKSEYVPWSKTYFLANLSEGLQESSQSVITTSVQDYHDKIYSDPTQIGFYSTIASVGKGTGTEFSAQGIDTFLSGYLMGSLIQGAQGVTMKASSKIAEKAKQTYQAATGAPVSESESVTAKAAAEKTDNDILNAANHVIDNSMIFGDHNVTMASAVNAVNKERKKAKEAGDTLNEKTLKDEIDITYLHTLAKTDNIGLVTGHVDDMLTLNDEDLANAYALPVDKAADIRKKLSTLKERAEGYKRKYDYQQRIMPNPGAPWLFDQKKYPEAYATELTKYMNHEYAMADLLFATEDYERVGERMSKIGNNLAGRGTVLQNLINVVRGGTPVANSAANDISVVIDKIAREELQTDLMTEIQALELGTAAQKNKAQDLRVQHDLLINLGKMTGNYISQMDSEQKAQFSEEEMTKRKQAARVQAGAKVVHKKDGTAYTVERIEGDRAIVKDAKGQYKSIKRTSLSVTQEKIGGKRLAYQAVEGDMLSESISHLYDSFEEYIRHVAKMNNGYVFDEQLQEAFSQLKDFYALERLSAGMVNTINFLSNPEHFATHGAMVSRVAQLNKEQRLQKLNEALKTFEELSKTNDFLKELFDLGVFIMPEDVDKLKDYSMVDFYSAADKGLVPPGSELFGKILDIVEKYAGTAGKDVTGKPISEYSPGADALMYNSKSRRKLANDERTYEDHAKQFGFDPKAPKSEVPVEQVLRNILDSKFATAREKALARRLLTIAKKGTVITFVNTNDGPGHFDTSTGEIIVDARYSSNDYKLGEKGHPIEHVILHEYGHMLTVAGYDADPEFKASIDKLLEAARAYQKTTAYKIAFGDKPLYGTKDAYEFITEALANDAFEAMLQSIPYTVSGKTSTAWDEFTDAVRKFFRRLLGVTDTNTALDEAMYVITSKIDSLAGGAPVAGATKAAPGVATELKEFDLVSTTTPIALIKTYRPSLFNKLIAGHDAWYNDVYDKPVPETDDDAIIASESFKRYMIEVSSTVIDAENKDVNEALAGTATAKVTGKPKTPKAQVGLVPEVITDEIYAGFQSTGKVASVILESIANKIIAQEKLSVREAAISTEVGMRNKLQEMLEIASNEQPRDYKGISLVYDLDIKTNTGEPGGAQYRDIKDEKTININPIALRKKYEEKAWTVSRKQADKSYSTPLPENLFTSYEQFVSFVLEHEFQHSVLTKGAFESKNPKATTGQYEDEINRRAMAALNLISAEETDEDTVDIMDQYSDITSKTELDEWRRHALDMIVSRHSREAISAKHNVDFNADFVKKLVADKEVNLAMSLNFEDLVPRTRVLMKDGKTIKVVRENDGKKVVLVSVKAFKTGDPTGGQDVTKDKIKDVIKMKHSDFVEKAEETEPFSDEEVVASDDALEIAKEVDPTTTAESIDKALDKSNDQARTDAANIFKKPCGL